MIKGKFLTPDAPETAQCFAVRRQVFIEEQGIDESEEWDEWDKYATFAAVYDEADRIVGTGRIIFDGDTYLLGRIAVLKECRGRQLGDFLVRMMADRCFAHGAQAVHLGAQDHAVGFYRKIGFEVCGEEYEDAGIPHFPMVLKREDFHGQCGHAISYEEEK